MDGGLLFYSSKTLYTFFKTICYMTKALKKIQQSLEMYLECWVEFQCVPKDVFPYKF